MSVLATLLPPEWTPLNAILFANFVIAWFILGPVQASKAETSAVVWSKFAIGKSFFERAGQRIHNCEQSGDQMGWP